MNVSEGSEPVCVPHPTTVLSGWRADVTAVFVPVVVDGLPYVENKRDSVHTTADGQRDLPLTKKPTFAQPACEFGNTADPLLNLHALNQVSKTSNPVAGNNLARAVGENCPRFPISLS